MRERSVAIKISDIKYIQVTLTSLSLKQPLSHSQIDTLVTIIWGRQHMGDYNPGYGLLLLPTQKKKKCMDLSSVVTVHHYPSVVSLF